MDPMNGDGLALTLDSKHALDPQEVLPSTSGKELKPQLQGVQIELTIGCEGDRDDAL